MHYCAREADLIGGGGTHGTGENFFRHNTTNDPKPAELPLRSQVFYQAQEEERKKGLFDVNGQIENFSQGDIGDCWLLGSVESLSSSEIGAGIISDSITNNYNATYSISLAGVGQTYLFSDDDLNAAINSGNYSMSNTSKFGDPDVLLFELAAERYITDIRNGTLTSPEGAPVSLTTEYKNQAENAIDGGNPNGAFYLLTGKKANIDTGLQTNIIDMFSSFVSGENFHPTYEVLEHSDNFWATAGFKENEDGTESTITTVDGKNLILTTGHTWSITAVDNKTLTLVNPWDNTQSYVVNRKDADQYLDVIRYYDFGK